MHVISKGSAHPQSEDLRRLVSYWPLASFFEARASAGLSHCSDTGLSLKQRIVPVRNPCEVDAYGVASHELQAMPAPVPSAAVSRTTALHPTPSSHHGPVISLRHAVHCEGVSGRLRRSPSAPSDLAAPYLATVGLAWAARRATSEGCRPLIEGAADARAPSGRLSSTRTTPCARTHERMDGSSSDGRSGETGALMAPAPIAR